MSTNANFVNVPFKTAQLLPNYWLRFVMHHGYKPNFSN